MLGRKNARSQAAQADQERQLARLWANYERIKAEIIGSRMFVQIGEEERDADHRRMVFATHTDPIWPAIELYASPFIGIVTGPYHTRSVQTALDVILAKSGVPKRALPMFDQSGERRD